MAGQERHRISKVFRFSARTLLLVTSVIAIGLAWMRIRVRDQSMAIVSLIQAGAAVHFDYQSQQASGGARRYDDDATIPGPTWLRAITGDDFFRSAIALGGKLSDVELAHVSSLRDLESVMLGSTPTRRPSDAGLIHLRPLTRLNALALASPEISDEGLKHLENLTAIENLDLGGCRITGAGFYFLRKLENLRLLRLRGNGLDSAGLANLKYVPSIQALDMHGTPVGDSQLHFLQVLPRIENLILRKTMVTDAGVDPLSKMASLRFVDLQETSVTASGIEKLNKALPGCKVKWKGNSHH